MTTHIYSGPTDLMILGTHSTAWTNSETNVDEKSEGFVYSCRDLLDNMRRQVVGCTEKIGMSLDATFNLLQNGWCLYSCGCCYGIAAYLPDYPYGSVLNSQGSRLGR
jgi:hypothetical protein